MLKPFGDSSPRYDQSGFTTKTPLGPNQTNFEISGNKISHTDISNWLNTSFKTSGIKTEFKLNQKESKLNIDMQNQKFVSRINELKKKIKKVIQENKNNDGFNLRSND